MIVRLLACDNWFVKNLKTHTTFGPLASIEGHTPDGRPFVVTTADVTAGHDGVVLRCVLYKNTPDLVHDNKGKMDLVYPTKTRSLATPSRATRTALDHVYTALHEGRKPGSYFYDQPRVGGALAKDVLIIDAISYVKATTESSLHLYRHLIELPENSKPTLAISKERELWFRNQDSVRVTERGIEDMPSKEIARVNPYTQENLKRALASSAYAGLSATGWIMLVNYGVSMLPANVKPYMTGYMGAAIKVGLGVAVAVGVDGALSEEQAGFRPAAAGIGVGGVVGGAMQALETYQAQNPPAVADAAVPPTFTTAAQYDAWHTLHPSVVITQPRPAAAPGAVNGFGGQFTGSHQQRQAMGSRR